MAAADGAARLRQRSRGPAPRRLTVRALSPLPNALVAAAVVVPVTHVARVDAAALVAYALATLAFGAVAARRPAFALAAYAIVLPFDASRALGPTTVSLPKVALIGIALGLAARRVSLAPLRARDLRPLLIGASAIVAATAVSVIPATYLDATLRETSKALEYLAVFLVAIVAFASDPDADAVWNGVGIAAAVVCALALVQEFTIAPSGLFLHGRIVPRIAGPLEGPNQLAGWCDVVLAVIAARALLGRPSRTFTALAVVVATTDALTLSRSGALGAIVALAVVAVATLRAGNGRRLRVAALAALVPLAVLGAVLGVGDASSRFATASFGARDEYGLASRSDLWHAALALWRTDPALGVGAGNFELLLPEVGLVGVRTHANSLYLQSLAEGGLALFGATVWTLVAAVALLRRASRDPLAIGVLAATLGLAAHQLFDCMTFYTKVGASWWLALGIGVAATLGRAAHERDTSSNPAGPGTPMARSSRAGLPGHAGAADDCVVTRS